MQFRLEAAAFRKPQDADIGNAGGVQFAEEAVEGPFERRVFTGAGHNLPQERPAEWAQAVLDVRKMAGQS